MFLLQNIDLVSVAIAVAAIGILGMVVFLNNRKSITNRALFFLSIFAILWGIFNYLSIRISDPILVLWFLRVHALFAVLYTFSLFHLFYVFPKQVFFLPTIYKFGLLPFIGLISVLTLTPLVFKQVTFTDFGSITGSVRGPGIILFAATVILLVVSGFVILAVKRSRVTGLERKKFSFVLVGGTITFALHIIFNLILPAAFNNPNYVQYGGVFVFPLIAFTSYAIIKHKLFDIRIFVLRAASFLLALAVLAGAYAFVLLTLIKQVLGLQFDATISAVSIVVALLILTTFRPLENFFRRLTNRIFHASHYNPDELLAQLNEAIKRTVDLERMTKETLDLLTKQIGLAKASWLLIDNHKIVGQHNLGFNFSEADMKEIEEILHVQEEIQNPKSKIQNNYQLPITNYQSPIIFDNLEESPTKDILRKHDISVIMPIIVEGAEIATLILGNKLSGEIYFTPDLNLLNVFASEAGFAIQNARLYENIKNLSEAKSKFISVVSHQLRTPVSALKWTLESLKARTNADWTRTDADRRPARTDADWTPTNADKAQTGEKIRELVDGAYKSSTFLGGQLDDIIVALDIYDRKLTLSKTMCSLKEMIGAIVKDLSEFIIPKRLVIKTDFEKGAEKVSADADKLKKILLILVRNAVVYSHLDGEIKISSKKDVGGEKLDVRGIVIKVEDWGIGIDPEEGKHIFDQFYRGERARTTMPDGLGLGLFIVKSFTEAHGGNVWFYSAGRDKGAEFYVSLPVADN